MPIKTNSFFISCFFDNFLKKSVEMKYQTEIEVAITSALETGEILKRYFKNRDKLQTQYKSKSGRGSPVTNADFESNEILKSKITSAFPDDGWLSEETIDDEARLNKQRVWIVDPLDGTNDFLSGVPEFSVSIALVEDKIPMLGVVYNPVSGELYFGVKGEGSFLLKVKDEEDGNISFFELFNSSRVQKLKVGDGGKIPAEASVIVSRKELKRVDKIKFLVSKFGQVKFRESIAYKIVSVASGWADAVVSIFDKSEWDLAGAHIIAEEAGFKVTDSRGEKIFYNEKNVRKPGVIVATDSLHEDILKILNSE